MAIFLVYLKTDILLETDVLETIRDQCFNIYEIDP